jgi:hypothetical protein
MYACKAFEYLKDGSESAKKFEELDARFWNWFNLINSSEGVVHMLKGMHVRLLNIWMMGVSPKKNLA